jgi:hypothetical protein
MTASITITSGALSKYNNISMFEVALSISIRCDEILCVKYLLHFVVLAMKFHPKQPLQLISYTKSPI